MEIKAWVKAARDKAGLTQEQLGEELGCTKGNVSAWENGRHDPSWAQIIKMSEISGVPVPAEQSAFRELERRRSQPRTDLLEISVYDVAGSMGNGKALVEYANVVEHITVSAAWLRSNVKFSAPYNLGLITAYGDSMEPTFRDGDILLVDRGIEDVKIDAVYVLALNDDLYIKRLQRRPDGAILMKSDNKNYEPYVIADGDLGKFHILGRVLMVWNAVKL